jgi:hypothetical protein
MIYFSFNSSKTSHICVFEGLNETTSDRGLTVEVLLPPVARSPSFPFVKYDLFISCETEEGYSEYPDIATELRRQDISKNTDSTEFEEID